MPKVQVSKNGKTYSIDESDLKDYVSNGFKPESDEEHVDRLGSEFKEDVYGGAAGKVLGAAAGVARGLSFGASDAVGSALGGGQMLKGIEDANPLTSTISNIVGAVAPTVLSGGALTPAGAVSRVSARIAEGGAGGIARHVAGAALEGAVQNSGSYLSDVALGDKELSAEGFVGAMGKGALYGGGAAGALKLGSKALSAARGLFPKSIPGAADVGASLADTPSLDLADAPVGRARGLAYDAVGPENAGQHMTAPDTFEPEPVGTFDDLKLAAGDDAIPRPVTPEPGDMPASRMFRGNMSKEADEATANASRMLAGHLDDSEQMLAAAQRRIDQARDIEDIKLGGKRPPQSDLSRSIDRIVDQEGQPTKRAFAGGDIPASKGKLFDSAGISSPTENEVARAGTSGDDLEAQLGESVNRLKSGDGMASMRPPPAEVADIAAKRAALEDAHQKVLEMLDREHLAPYAGAKTVDDRIAIAMEQLKGLRGPSVAEKIAADAEAPAAQAAAKPIDEQITDALTRHTKEPNLDLKEAIDKLGPYEKAHADLTDALGDEAPASAQANAKSYNDSVAEQHAKVAQQQADGAGTLENAMTGSVAAGKAAAGAKAGGIMGALKDATTAAHLLGLPVSGIPVIGPVLGLFLKGRAMVMVAKRMGLRVPLTAESVIASKSAEHIARIRAAVDKALEVGSKATGRASASGAAGAAAVLGHKLFDDGSPKSPGVGDDDLSARRDELVRAQRPGAVEAMVQDRVRASDPTITEEVTKAVKRKLDYLYSVVPKPPVAPGMLPGANASWTAAPSLVTSFQRSVAACDDPAGVLETLASGKTVTFEAAEALRNVYPRLFQTAQMQVVKRAQDVKTPLPYAKRVQLSILFQVPLDGTMAPQYQAALSVPYQAPQGKPTGSAPPMSGLHADVTLGARTSTGLDQRGTR